MGGREGLGRRMAASLANWLSIARIALVLSLMLVRPLSTLFFVIYLISGLTDTLDGFVARKTNSESKLGEKLDSAADLVMVIVLLVIFLPSYRIEPRLIVWIAVICVIRLVSIALVRIKYRTFGMLHTYGNKITGFLLFAAPMFLKVLDINTMLKALCAVASIASIEELVIHVSSDEFVANRRSIINATCKRGGQV